jgi:predicted small lipoprotein YifL
MKKLFGVLLLFIFVFSLSACGNKSKPGVNGPDEYKVSEIDVATNVKGWDLFTNPAFRYEIRFPNSYGMSSSGEDGKLVKLFQEEENINLALLFRGHINFINNYTLEEFYQNSDNNLYEQYDYEDVYIDGEKSVLFKNVAKYDGDQIIDLLAVDRKFGIIEIEIFEPEDSEVKTILNSINFYPAGGKVIIK